MKNNLVVLKSVELFNGIEEADLLQLLSCLSVKRAVYEKGQTEFSCGEVIDRFGIVLSGEVKVVQDELTFGNRSILAESTPAICSRSRLHFASNMTLSVSVYYNGESEIMFIYSGAFLLSVLRPAFSHEAHSKPAEHNSRKTFCLRRRSNLHPSGRHAKNCCLPLGRGREAGNSRFSIPFNRQELRRLSFR